MEVRMKRNRFTVKQKVGILREAEVISPRAGASSILCSWVEEADVAESARVALRLLAYTLLTFSRIQTD
jgi:hypothetical protein